MNTKAIIGVSILAVVLLVLGSQANVVGYQTVQSSVKERLNEKDLLFQTICDLANNKEIQKAILESQGKFQNPFPASQLTSFPTITKRQLNSLYILGVVLFKMMGKARMESLIKAHPINVQTNEKIISIIGNNTVLKEEMAQLSVLNCPSCESTWLRPFPVICFILYILIIINMLLSNLLWQIGYYMPIAIFFSFMFLMLAMLAADTAKALECPWYNKKDLNVSISSLTLPGRDNASTT
jgi:hypothetical protein